MKRILILLYCLLPTILFAQGILSTLGDMHSVVKGETWESVAASHGISVVALKAANPDVKKAKLKKGTLLIIPQGSLNPSNANSNVETAAGNIGSPYVRVGMAQNAPALIRTSISDLKVGVLLPLADKRMVEFYRGLLMAADSVRKSGVNLDIHAWDCGVTTAQVESLLPNLQGLDVLFGPASATQIPQVAEACKEQGIRMVLPFYSGQTLLDYPLVYNVTAPSTYLYEAALAKMMSFYPDMNYVIVRCGNADTKGKNFTDAVVHALAQKSATPRTLDLNGDDFAYESAFNQFRGNVIVLDNSDAASLNSLLSRLKAFRAKHSQYRFSLLGFADWQDETDRLLDDFFAFDTYIVSPYYYNVLDDRIRNFESAYWSNFRTSVIQSNPRFAALGFDLGCYFLTGLGSLGDTFDQMQGSIRQQPYQSWFRFERGASGLSFFNNFVQFIHYTPENRVELIR
ncbi:MAG: LysM peptidoglycan-binding domain-containing protein [Bacteroidaceae bacterium]|nr:LysM peptidoglycan-binding domain-containing protein [Bacteroidaceae bacterium]